MCEIQGTDEEVVHVLSLVSVLEWLEKCFVLLWVFFRQKRKSTRSLSFYLRFYSLHLFKQLSFLLQCLG